MYRVFSTHCNIMHQNPKTRNAPLESASRRIFSPHSNVLRLPAFLQLCAFYIKRTSHCWYISNIIHKQSKCKIYVLPPEKASFDVYMILVTISKELVSCKQKNWKAAMDTFVTKDKMSKCPFCYSETSTTTPPINQQLCEHHLTKSNSNDSSFVSAGVDIVSNPTQGPSPSIALSTWISDHGPTPRGLASSESAPVLRPNFFL